MNPYDFDVLVAKCGKAVGLKGDVRLALYTDFMEIFAPNALFKCGDSVLELESFNKNNNCARFVGIDDVGRAKMLNSRMLYTTKEITNKYCKLSVGEFFWYDIVGMSVYDEELLLGVVGDIERIGDVDYLIVDVDMRIHANYKHIKAKKFLLPYISRYILDVDMQNKRIKTIDSLEVLEAS